MTTPDEYTLTFNLDQKTYRGTVRIEQRDDTYRAIIHGSPLHGTYGGYAASLFMALDFLNLAMQAEGADEIHIDNPGEQAA